MRLGSSLRDGVVTVELDVSADFAPGWRLAFTSGVPMEPDPRATESVEQIGTHRVIAPVPARSIGAGSCWSVKLTPAPHR